MSWKYILKNEEIDYDGIEEKAEPILEKLMNGIDTFEEQLFSPKDVMPESELEEANKEWYGARVYDTMFGRASFTITMKGEVTNGYYEGNIISMADAIKINKEMLKAQEKEFRGETQRSQIGYAETPDEYYYN